MYLANQSLSVMEYHNNRYLATMGSDLRVKLGGFKVRADGTIKEEITATIIRERERSFASFSGGEKGRLLFASILANRHMINETHPYGGLDFLFIDEVLDATDGTGIDDMIDSVKDFGFPIMIVSQVTSENSESNENVLLIVKENEISTIYKK